MLLGLVLLSSEILGKFQVRLLKKNIYFSLVFEVWPAHWYLVEGPRYFDGAKVA